jgi:hypothetical protein
MPLWQVCEPCVRWVHAHAKRASGRCASVRTRSDVGVRGRIGSQRRTATQATSSISVGIDRGVVVKPRELRQRIGNPVFALRAVLHQVDERETDGLGNADRLRVGQRGNADVE